MMKKIVIGLISLGLMSSAYADDLWQVFQLASQNAQTIHANASTRDASVDSFRSKFLGFFPQASASATYNDVGYDSGGASANYKNRVYTVQVSQVIFNPNLWNQVLGAKKTAQSAIATYQYQYQQFIQQVIQDYFTVLEDQDLLAVADAKTKHLKSAYDQAKAEFTVGTVAATAMKQALAQYREAQASEISANNNLQDAIQSLQVLTGVRVADLKALNKTIPVRKPNPADPNYWIKKAETFNQSLVASQYTVESSRATLEQTYGNRWPVFSIVGTYTKNEFSATNAAVISAAGLTNSDDHAIALQMTWNIFTGATGANGYSVDVAADNYAASQANLLQAVRNTAASVASDYQNVVTDISKIAEYKASVEANQAAVEQYEAMFKVGTATMIDVLDRIQDLYNQKSLMLQAEYQYVNDIIQLKLDAGTLNVSDVHTLNTWLIV